MKKIVERIEEDFKEIERVIGYSFKDKNLLKRSITHKSYSNEHINVPNNEKLEFLGDGLLQGISTMYIYKKYPELVEGELTQLRASLVDTNALSNCADRLNIRKFVLVSKGQSKDINTKYSKTLLADAIEAIIAAIYLDSNDLKLVEKFIVKNLFYKLESGEKVEIKKDYKTILQEFTQENQNTTPNYSILKTTGPDHDKQFVIAVSINEEQIATGKGRNKKDAEMIAAALALKLLKSKC